MIEKYLPYQTKLDFINEYCNASNAASASQVDANANVERKTIATMESEMPKKDSIMVNRLMMHHRIKELYDEDLANQYLKDLESHILYRHDETANTIAALCSNAY